MEETNGLKDILLWVVSAGGLTVIGQLLRFANVTQRIPAAVRPFLGPALGLLASVLSSALGIPVDLSLLEGALLGTTSAMLFDLGRGTGVLSGTGTGK
jgi:hypothetical protein